MSIHPSTTIDEHARISPEAQIGPYCVIEGEVDIGAHTVVESHARIGSRFGTVTIGEHNHIQHGAVLGGAPQDLGYLAGAPTALTIGNHNRIGEFVSINLGSEKGAGITRVGDHNFIMAYVHVGHDCQLADHIVVTNAAQFAGHIVIEHHALISGLVGVTQFCRLGAYSFLVAGAFANKDIPPFTIAEGHWATPRAVNRVGLKRAGFDSSERRNIDHAVRILLDRTLTIEEVMATIRQQCSPSPQIEHFVNFLKTSDRGIARG
ncbi:MAG TPA: acyl-ACP--UDP-N-acetylglucosamine O-acyltransferase [Gammaproteobacteria bacterium]|nr:acyl-ACP--UDP-N-acetylglucosamine O-acyltransferase [Gammaproteobacteria bacterium]